MDNWQMSMHWVGAFRAGFCIPKLISLYGPIWTTSLQLQLFILPCIQVVMSTPQVRHLFSMVRSTARRVCSQRQSNDELHHLHQDLHQVAMAMQEELAAMMNLMTVAIGFGLWVFHTA